MTTDTLTLVIATGQGEGLMPLTLHRAKAAVPFGGKFRVIDFTLANCLHSGLRRVLVLTQYKSHSLQKHLRDGWSIFHPELGEFITPVPPQMRDGHDWYTGCFSAMRQNRYLIERSDARYVLVLEGDLVYRMDYAELIRFHRDAHSEISLACRTPDEGSQSAARCVELSEDGRVTAARSTPVEAGSIDRDEACVPMGVYLFDKRLLLSFLESEERVRAADASSLGDAVAGMARDHRTYAYRFGGERGRVTPDRYWCDLADLDAFYAANIALLETQPPLDLYQEDWNILTYQGQYPPARTVPGLSGTEGIFVNSMLAAGTVIGGGGVNHSILFPRVHIRDGAIVEDAILFNDVRVGQGAHLRRCIVDKDVVIPPKERIGFDLASDRERFTLSASGVVVIPKGFRF
jgi:glucose-1-phosphate adenylyltransferase